jgi:hypothetical protein
MVDGLGGLQPKSPNISLQKSGVKVGVGVDQLTPENLNLIEGSNVSINTIEDLTNRRYNVTFASTGGGGSGAGFTRSINLISVDTTAGNNTSTDYFYIATGSLTITLPASFGNTNLYSIKNTASVGSIVILPNGSDTIETLPSISILTPFVSIDLISNGTGWNII